MQIPNTETFTGVAAAPIAGIGAVSGPRLKVVGAGVQAAPITAISAARTRSRPRVVLVTDELPLVVIEAP